MAVSSIRASTRTLSHVLLSGHNLLSPPASTRSTSLTGPARQSPSNPSLTPASYSAWLAAVGREADTEEPYRIRPAGIAGGGGHQLLAYRNYEGVDRVLALGRNETGQLGVGFASQEGTRGLVEGFEGDEVLAVRAGVQSSYLLVRDGDSTTLYSMGNLARGRLGHPALFSTQQQLDEYEEPRQYTLPRATAIQLPEDVGRIKQIEAGFEHLLVLTESGDIFGTGCNTDGQLGLGSASSDIYQLTRLPLPYEVVKDGGVERISAGADTSALVTREGTVWVWGNSEYCQGMHGEKIDQILSPLAIDASFLPSNRRIIDYRCGGSFALALDDRGSVYSAGYGALGLGAEILQAERPQRVEELEGEGISRIRAGWGYAAAVRDAATDSALFSWGLNTLHGRLGLGALPPSRQSTSDPNAPPAVPTHIYTPQRVHLPLRELGLDGSVAGRENATWALGEVELGSEAMWVALEAQEEVD